jgi:hypothetical protein
MEHQTSKRITVAQPNPNIHHTAAPPRPKEVMPAETRKMEHAIALALAKKASKNLAKFNKNGLNARTAAPTRYSIGADWIAGLHLDEQTLKIAKEIDMINLSWPALRIYQHLRNVLLRGGFAAARFPTSEVVCIFNHLMIIMTNLFGSFA